MSEDKHARKARADKLEAKRSSPHDMVSDANNASAINLLQDESIFQDAEVLLYSQRKNGKSGDERAFKGHLDENCETGKVSKTFKTMDVTQHDFANNSQTDDQNLDVQMHVQVPDKVHGDLDMAEDSIFQQSIIEQNLLSNRHIVSVKTKG